MKKLFMFWEYDKFPYLLGAEMLSLHDNGSAEPKGYQSMRFKPVKILPLTAGKRLNDKLQQLKRERDEAFNALGKVYDKKLKDILGE